MSSERSIPHLRDIFGISGYSSPHTNKIDNGYGGGGGVHQDHIQHQNQTLDFNKKNSKKKRDNSKTLTSGDVKTLERHLSMKKTIRKKIMRDLQQAFVEDPNEFRVDNTSSEKLKAEIRAEAFRFGGDKPTRETDNFLDMLRGEKQSREYSENINQSSRVYNNYQTNEPQHNQSNGEKQSFWRRFALKVKR